MKDSSDYSGAHLLIAFLAGAAAGAAVAILSTPKTGSETRDSLAEWARDAQGKATKVPGAVKDAYVNAAKAAGDAFTRALRDEVEAQTEPVDEPDPVDRELG